MRGESKASERRIESADRKRQALELRKSGATFEQIRDTLGYSSVSGAFKAVMSALRDITREPAEEVRALELERLDKLLLAVWPRALSGDDKAIRRALDITERRARYLGLDAPTKIDISREVRRAAIEAGLSEEDATAAVREAMAVVNEAQQ